jgi:hypothetical protein
MNLSIENTTRIRYTLPGYVPELESPANGSVEEDVGAAFQSRIRALQQHDSVTWKQALSLDQIAPGPAQLSPPPKPASLDVRDSGDERLRWHSLLSVSSANSPPEVVTMLSLLRNAQQASEAVLARSIAASGV